MMKRWPVVAVVVGVLLLSGAAAVYGEEIPFQVIVNTANPVDSLTREELGRLFLKKTTKWKHGGMVWPVDLIKTSQVRAAFSEQILGSTTDKIESFWMEKLLSGSAVPPVVKAADTGVISYVMDNKGAIGYVSAEANIKGVRGVRIVTAP